jgi:hypothetical protein
MIANSPGTLAAADDGQRMILLCVLHDASESLIAIASACPQCTAAGFTCDAHWNEIEETDERYRQLRTRLAGSCGLAMARPLTAGDRETLTEALARATSYRHNGAAAEDAALIAAYEQLGRCFAAEPIPA